MFKRARAMTRNKREPNLNPPMCKVWVELPSLPLSLLGEQLPGLPAATLGHALPRLTMAVAAR